jgi:AcrR family transcriptional regulator
MAKKAPRRTAERILETTLDLFNRFGEPNVSTTAISAALGISPGNLYYHFPAKDELVNALFLRYETALNDVLAASGDVQDVEDAWFLMHTLFEQLWQYRFLYRDLNHLLSRNRLLETQFQALLGRKAGALQAMLRSMRRRALQMEAAEIEPTATSMAVLLTYWLSYEYVRDPRRALEDANAQAAVLRGAHHVLGLLSPYLEPRQRQHLQQLAAAYMPS